ETRIAASSVPSTVAMSIDQPSSCSVTMNPSDRREINSDRYTAVKLLPERGDPAGARYTPAPAGMTLGLLAGVQFRGIRGLDARLAQRRLEGLGPRAVVVGLLQGVVDEFAELGVAVLVTDAVALLAERLADDFEFVGRLGRVPQQDGAVGGHRVDGAVLQLGQAVGVGVERHRLGAVVVDHVGQRRRPGDRAGLDVGQLLGSGDGVLVLLADEDLLPGDVIRPGLADD